MRCKWSRHAFVFCCAALLVWACAPATPPQTASAGEGVVGQEAPPPVQSERAAAALDIVYEKFGEIVVNGEVWTEDIVVEDGEVREREKGPSRDERAKYGHTPLTPREAIPWECETLVVGTGMHGRLPIVAELEQEAERRNVKLVILETTEAVKYFREHFGPGLNAVFHITC